MTDHDPFASTPPYPQQPGATMPPEGTWQRAALRERVDALLEKLAEDLQSLPLQTPPTVNADRAVLCLDCPTIFEAEGPQKCPRCASLQTVRCVPRPLLPVGEEGALAPAIVFSEAN